MSKCTVPFINSLHKDIIELACVTVDSTSAGPVPQSAAVVSAAGCCNASVTGSVASAAASTLGC